MKFILLVLITVFAFANEKDLGLKVGSKSPNIKIKNTFNKEFNLSKLSKTTVLVFFRGSWCPYCMKQLKDLNEQLVPKIGANVNLFAISVDRAKVAKKMKRKFKYSFDVFSDPKAKTLKAFNIINKLSDDLVSKYKNSYSIDVESDSGETHHMVAHPAVFIIKGNDIIFSDVHVDYKQRTSIEMILKALK